MRVDLLPTTFEGKLDRLQEECAEVIIAITKLRRFGKLARDERTGIEYDNIRDLRREIDDLNHAISEAKGHL